MIYLSTILAVVGLGLVAAGVWRWRRGSESRAARRLLSYSDRVVLTQLCDALRRKHRGDIARCLRAIGQPVPDSARFWEAAHRMRLTVPGLTEAERAESRRYLDKAHRAQARAATTQGRA